MKNKQYIVIGLGIFGSTVVKTLSEYGCEVLAIDRDPNCVQKVADFATKAIIGDIKEEGFLDNLGIDGFDVGIVAIGDQLEDSIMSVLALKEIGIPYVIAKAKDRTFELVLQKVGVDLVVRPEKQMGERLAKSLLRKNITDLIELDENYSVVEIKVPQAWIDRSLKELNLRQNYGINILGKRNQETYKLEMVIDPEYKIQRNDHFLMIAETKEIERLDYLVEK